MLGQGRLEEAEDYLLAGFAVAGMKEQVADIPRLGLPRLIDATDYLIDLYTQRQLAEEAEKWTEERKTLLRLFENGE